MKLFYNSLPAKKADRAVRVLMSGQSIAQGQYSLASAGYPNDKIYATNGTYLECRTGPDEWLPFEPKMLSPYQYRADFGWGSGMEWSLAEHFRNNGDIPLWIYKPAWGAQKFGTDSKPGKFHVSAAGDAVGSIIQDMERIMNAQKNAGIEFDFMLWMHGESDGRDSMGERNAYEENLRRFIAKLRTIQPGLPFLIRLLPIETEGWMGAVNPGGRDAINTAFMNVINDTDDCYAIHMPVPFSQGDSIHPSNPTGNDQMAQAYWDILETII